jgi:tetratricopeptide (TPR) repeat protein
VKPPVPDDEDGLDLGAWLRGSEPAPSTRMTAAAPAQSDDEQATFAEQLRAFTAGVARAVTDADYDSHYDLGVAYREMGLLDEAIGAFQRASRDPAAPLRGLEALAQCFLDRGDPELAIATLAGVARTLDERPIGPDGASTVGVCYLLGASAQQLGHHADARRWFVRVLALDYAFRDAAARLASLPPSA